MPDDPTPQDAVSRLELSRYMRNQLLRDADVMSMACGVELRVPFLDAAARRHGDARSRRARLAAGEALLLQAVPEIPAWVAAQPKARVHVPVRAMARRRMARSVFARSIARSPVPTGTWYRKVVFVFALRTLDAIALIAPTVQCMWTLHNRGVNRRRSPEFRGESGCWPRRCVC